MEEMNRMRVTIDEINKMRHAKKSRCENEYGNISHYLQTPLYDLGNQSIQTHPLAEKNIIIESTTN